MDPGNQVCSSCRVKPADMFCTCSDSETLLCKTCFLKHSSRLTRKGGHTMWSISELLVYKDSRYIQRKEAFFTVKEQAESGIHAIDKAIDEYRTWVSKVIEDVKSSEQETLTSLQQTRNQLSLDITAALEEIQSSLHITTPRLHSKYGPMLRTLIEHPETVDFFTYTIPEVPRNVLACFPCEFRLQRPDELLAERIRKKAKAETRTEEPPALPAVLYDAGKEPWTQVEARYMEAVAVYTTHYPLNLELAGCYYNFGSFYKSLKRFESAEVQLLNAIRLYERLQHQSITYVKCLSVLGSVYQAMDRLEDSKAQWLKAVAVGLVNFPADIHYANCLVRLGEVYRTLSQPQLAEEQLLKAIDVYQTHFPNSVNFAAALSKLGSFYSSLKQTVQAEDYYLRAVHLFSTSYPRDNAYAQCLVKLAYLVEVKGEKKTAVGYLKKALEIYEQNGVQSETTGVKLTLQRLDKSK